MTNKKILRSFTLIFGLQITSLVGVAGTAEDASTCRFWNTLDEPRKTFYILGYADGAHTMAVYVNVILERKRIDPRGGAKDGGKDGLAFWTSRWKRVARVESVL